MNQRTKITLQIVLFLFTTTVSSQILDEKTVTKLKLEHGNLLAKLYANKTSNPDLFVHGELYVPKGNNYNYPYFESNAWQPASVVYQNKEYKIALAKYDIEIDALIFLKEFSTTAYPIMLNKTLIQEFYINSKHFITLEDRPDQGYFELIYNTNEIQLLAKWLKKSSYGESNTIKYKTSSKLFIKKDNGLYNINTIAQFFNLFTDKKKELKSYKKENKLDYSNNRIETINSLINYYYTLQIK